MKDLKTGTGTLNWGPFCPTFLAEKYPLSKIIWYKHGFHFSEIRPLFHLSTPAT
jgi:hypothetical protein